MEMKNRERLEKRTRECGLKIGDFSVRARSRGEFLGLSSQVPEASDRQNIALPDIDKSPDIAAADFVLNGVYKTEATYLINDANRKKNSLRGIKW